MSGIYLLCSFLFVFVFYCNYVYYLFCVFYCGYVFCFLLCYLVVKSFCCFYFSKVAVFNLKYCFRDKKFQYKFVPIQEVYRIVNDFLFVPVYNIPHNDIVSINLPTLYMIICHNHSPCSRYSPMISVILFDQVPVSSACISKHANH